MEELKLAWEAANKPKHNIVIKGTLDQISAAKEALAKQHADETNHFSKYELEKLLSKTVFDDIAAICKQKYDV